MTTVELAKLAARTLDERKAVNIEVLDVKGLSTLADFFIIASADNFTLVKALCEYVDEAFSKQGHEPRHIERDTTGNWILLDYGDIIIHIFYGPTREFYNLTGLWGDAKRYGAQEFVEKYTQKD